MLAALFAVAALTPDTTAGPCEVIGDPALLRDVPEASGLAISRRHRGLLWTHNDSGNEPDLFAIDAAGASRGRVRLPIRTRDWEDISVAPCPAGDCLYVGDIGDNALARRRVRIYRLPEPDPGATQTMRPDVFDLTYPDGPHNAEGTFLVGGRLFIVTKDRVGTVFASVDPLDEPGAVALRRVAQLGLAAVTDAEASPDGALVAVRTPSELAIYRSADITRGGSVQPVERISISGLREPQGEGVALGEDGVVYLASEGRPWNRAGRFVALRCPTRLP